jgi:N-acetylmuramoyl-L-alanine amidase
MTGKYLLDHVNIPGCLIEVGFITNIEDLGRLTNEAYINDLAMLISISINEVYSR